MKGKLDEIIIAGTKNDPVAITVEDLISADREIKIRNIKKPVKLKQVA